MSIVTVAPVGDVDASPAPLHDPDLGRVLPLIAARLRQRFPGETAETIQLAVDAAAARGAAARVRTFLPILIERWAADALAGA